MKRNIHFASFPDKKDNKKKELKEKKEQQKEKGFKKKEKGHKGNG